MMSAASKRGTLALRRAGAKYVKPRSNAERLDIHDAADCGDDQQGAVLFWAACETIPVA